MLDLHERLQELADAATRQGATPGAAHAIRRGRLRIHDLCLDLARRQGREPTAVPPFPMEKQVPQSAATLDHCLKKTGSNLLHLVKRWLAHLHNPQQPSELHPQN